MRRGQITTFIIVGLLLVLAGGILLYVQQLEFRETISYPEGVAPIANYITQCIQDATASGVQILGQQGGYITLPYSIAQEPRRYLPLDTLNLRKVPFYVQEGRLSYPTLAYMEQELDTYIAQETLRCLDWSAFPQFTIEPQGELTIATSLTDNDVYVEAHYPIRATEGDRQYDIDRYNTEVDARVKTAYELAGQIAEYQYNTHQLENLTINLLAIDPNMPMDDLSFSCSPQRWTVQGLRERHAYVLQQNMPNIRVRNTNHFPFTASESTYQSLQRAKENMHNELVAAQDTIDIEDTRAYPRDTPVDAFEYNNMYFDVGASNDGLQATFQYDPTYGMNFNVVPNANGALKSSDVRGPNMLRFLCMQQYHFLYDVQYPVLVSVRDPESLGGEGYRFDFALYVTVDDNEARDNIWTHNQIEELIRDEDFCAQLGQQSYDLRAQGIDEYGYVSEIANANITYICASRSCDMGRTSARSGVYRLITRLPSGCSNPYIMASRAGYLPGQTQMDETREGTVRVPLTKLKHMNVEVVKHRYYSQDNTLHEAMPLEEEEQVTLFLNIPDHKHEQYAILPNETSVDVIDGDGNYELYALLTRRDTVLGGYMAQKISIKYSDINGKDTMTLHVFEYLPTPFTDSAQESMMLYMLGTQNTMRPTFR